MEHKNAWDFVRLTSLLFVDTSYSCALQEESHRTHTCARTRHIRQPPPLNCTAIRAAPQESWIVCTAVCSVSPLDVCYFVSPSKPLCERLVTLRRLVDIRTTLPVVQQPLRTSAKLHGQFFILSHRSSGLKISWTDWTECVNGVNVSTCTPVPVKAATALLSTAHV